MTAIQNVNKGSSPNFNIPSGIPTLNSLMGEMVVSKTQVTFPVIICFQNSAPYDREA